LHCVDVVEQSAKVAKIRARFCFIGTEFQSRCYPLLF